MISKDTRVNFNYSAQNHKKSPINLNFAFDLDAQYVENLKLFKILLTEALLDVQEEIDLKTKGRTTLDDLKKDGQ